MFLISFIYNSQTLEATQISIKRGVGKQTVVYPYRGTIQQCKGTNY